MRRSILINFSTCQFFVVAFILLMPAHSRAQTELIVLDESNYADWVPAGKEVDAIYGDLVLRNQHLVAVIGRPGPRRHANMTVGNVGGCIIDLTRREHPNDQLSAYYPLGGQFRFTDESKISVSNGQLPLLFDDSTYIHDTPTLRVSFEGKQVRGSATVVVTYSLNENDQGIEIETKIDNSSSSRPINVRDMIRADRTFSFGTFDKRMGWAYDNWFHQAYGVVCDGESKHAKDRRDYFLFSRNDKRIVIPAGESESFSRRLFPAKDLVELFGIVFDDDDIFKPFELDIVDSLGPVQDAKVTLASSDSKIVVRTDASGQLRGALPASSFQMSIDAPGRPTVTKTLDTERPVTMTETLESTGFVSLQVTDSNENPIPFKVSFFGSDGTKNPFFGPDSRAQFVHNTAYSANGRLERVGLAPGKYQCVISRGSEYDASLQDIEVKQNEETVVNAQLKRSVQTPGWISAEFHSHSSPSGDNTSEQRGRVLNLLAEHIEFAPCTEHNRVDSYQPHLDVLNAQRFMATCTGMELTGGPTSVNHQNAFPLVWSPRTQDGGGPSTDGNPVVQIQRLAMWNNGSEKLVQMNHPNLMQILGDRDADGTSDEGYAEMFDYTDVIEIHPLHSVFQRETELPEPGSRGNTIFQWLQLLNHGYRIPGVVNTDAHYNFHGSGWLRNYIRSSTDEPEKIDTLEMVRNSTAGRIVMTNGPYLEVSLVAKDQNEQTVTAQIGDEVQLGNSKVQLRIKVQCPDWLDINRVQILVNGRMDESLNFRQREMPAMFASGVVKFDQQIELEIDEDSHVIVAVAGEGLKLGQVMGPGAGQRMPVAVSNPIFLDVDGNGFQPNRDSLGAPMTFSTNR